MKETGIIMSGDHPVKILAGRKTQTRRVIKPQPDLLYGIYGDIIQLYHNRRAEDDRVDIKTDTNISKRQLYGWERWQDLLTNQIQGLWQEGFRGVVSLSWMPNGEEGLFNCYLMPQRQESNNVSTQASMYGFPRATTQAINADQAFGWQPREQQALQSKMGNSIRQLAGQDSTQSEQSELQQPQLKNDPTRTRAYSLGSQGGDSQQETYISGSRNKSAFHFRNMPWSIGQRLWVRETWAKSEVREFIYLKADGSGLPSNLKWKPSIHMSRWASRINLEITEVRVERVQEIEDTEDLLDEGMTMHPANCETAYYPLGPEARSTNEFKALWDSLNAKRGYGWDMNPWLWVISFRRLDE